MEKGKEKKVIKILVCIFLCTLFVFIALIYIGSGNKKEEVLIPNIKKENNAQLDSIFAFIQYEEISIKFHPQNHRININIMLPNKATKDELRSIGAYYHDKYMSDTYKRLYIYYYTSDMKDCYATTHCEPNVEVVLRIQSK